MGLVGKSEGMQHQATTDSPPTTCLRTYLCDSAGVEVAEELDAISRPQLNLFVPDANELPQYRVDQFALVDSNFEPLPIDTALLAAGHDIFLYGTIKPLIQFGQPEAPPPDADNAHRSTPQTNGQASSKRQLARLGPIDEWFLFGFDGGLDLVVVISTEYAHYLVEHAAPPYAPHHTPFLARALVCKFVFETLLGDYAISFEHLVERCSEKLARWKSCTTTSSNSTAASAPAKSDDGNYWRSPRENLSSGIRASLFLWQCEPLLAWLQSTLVDENFGTLDF
ncbi:MAG: DNA (cytosine-5)-methyltransferase 1 [Marteilia pararefringens]